MATGKTMPSGFCSDGLGDEELQDERTKLPKTANKMIKVIFKRKSSRRLIVQGYSDLVRDQDYKRLSTPRRRTYRECHAGKLTHLRWTGATDSPLEGSLSLIAHSGKCGRL